MADRLIRPAVEELEELDDELDVADAAPAGLDLDLVGPLGAVRASIRRFIAWISAISAPER